MASAEDRMSTEVVEDLWIPPDERHRILTVDYEAGPFALNNTSKGSSYQPWVLTWDSGTDDFILTPETTGAPVVGIHSAPLVTQCSLAFDQNAHVSIAYTSNGLPYLYWYDTLAAGWVTTPLQTTAITPTLTLDDKRTSQSNASDIILFYNVKEIDDSYSMYRRLQRERFLNEKLYLTNVPQYIYKVGMHFGFRIQFGFSPRIL